MAREVLVVEDEPDIRRLVVLHLERDGFRCRTATSGSDALREVKTAVPDLVVLDLMLPELDGLEVCRRLRRDSSTASRSEEHTSELQSQFHLVCRLLLEKKKKITSLFFKLKKQKQKTKK